MKFLYAFVTIIFFLPFIGYSLYMIFYPEDSVLLGRRWQFKNRDLEPSEEAIKYEHKMGILTLIIEVILLVSFLFTE